MIDDPLRAAFESIDDNATDTFREALRQRCLAELRTGEATDHARSGRVSIGTQFIPMKEMYMSPIDPPRTGNRSRRRLLMTAAVAAVVVIGVVGVVLANRNGDDQTPVPAVAATVAPTSTVAATTTSAPATHTVSFVVDSAPSISVSFTAPQSWTVAEGWSAYLPGSDDRSTAVAGVGFEAIGNIFAEGCQWLQLDPAVGPSIDDLVEAWTNLPDFAVTEPVDVTIDGYAGKQIELTVPDYDKGDCKESHFALWYSGPDPQPGAVPPGYWAQAPRQHIKQWILDVDGTRLVIFAGISPSASPQERADLDAALASIEIG